ncbi:MAG TPA: glycosyltransferase [Methanolinea sp.]|nr:glycosyltransferase [Methanolinea sp.]
MHGIDNPPVSHRKKVLFLASWFPNKEDRYSGIFIKRHAQAVSKYCAVSVLYIHFTKNNIPKEIDIHIEDGITIIRIYIGGIGQKSIILKILSFIFWKNGIFFVLKGLKKVFKCTGTPDIVHLNVILPAGMLALFLKYFFQIPYVITEHTNPFSIFLSNPIKRFLSKLILKNSKHIMPVSIFLQNSINSFYRTYKYSVIPNVVNTDLFTPKGEIRKINDKKVMLHVSRLNDQLKNISGILDAVWLLSKGRDDFVLIIIGDGNDRERLELKANQLEINRKFVFFLGNKTDEELACYMRNSNFFILNSREETFCVVCIEALSSGIPIIATKCGAPEEYITSQMGLLIPVDDSVALVDSLNYMLDNYQKYSPDELHNTIKIKFGSDFVGNQYYSIYLSIIEK